MYLYPDIEYFYNFSVETAAGKGSADYSVMFTIQMATPFEGDPRYMLEKCASTRQQRWATGLM